MSSSDLALLQRWCAERDAEAFAEVAKRHAGMVFGVCRRVLGNETDAEDIAQECFVALAQSAVPPQANLPGWLYRVAVNKARDHVRSDSRRRRRETSYQQSRPDTDEIHWGDIEAFVDEAIAGLPDELREPLVAHFVLGQTQIEIAERIGVSRQTITHRIGQGVERVRKDLAKRGIGVTASALTLVLTANMAEAAPATLVAALGKLAVSGIPIAAGASMLGGLVTAKSAGVAVAAVILFGIVGMAAFQMNRRAPVQKNAALDANATTTGHSASAIVPSSSGDQGASTRAAAAPSGDALPVIRIVDMKTKEPVSGIDVVFYQYGVQWKLEGTSDAAGRVPVPALAPGDYRVLLRRSAYYLAGGTPAYEDSDGYPKVRFTVDAKSACPAVQVDVLRGATVSGRVYDERRDEPVPEVFLNVVTSNTNREWLGLSAKTDEQGMYRLEGLPPGRWEVSCWCLKDREYRLPVDILPACEPVTNMDFVVDRGIRVSGRVTSESGQPVANATVRGVLRANGNHEAKDDLTDPDGHFNLYGFVLSGQLNLQASEVGGLSEITGPYELTSDMEGIEITLKPGPIVSGIVIDGDGQPVAGAQLSAYYLPENFPAVGPNERGVHHNDFNAWRVATANPDGSFQFQGLYPGIYGLNAKAPGDSPPSWGDMLFLKRIELKWGHQLNDVRLALGQPEQGNGLTIAGRVLTQDGRPVPGAEVMASKRGGAWYSKAKANTNGDFSLPGLDEGEHSVIASSADIGESEKVYAPAGSRGVNLHIQPNASIKGSVVDAVSGNAIGRFKFLCQDSGSVAPQGILKDIAVESRDGMLEESGVKPGSKDLSVLASGYRIFRESFQVEPGETKVLNVRLQPSPPLSGIVVDEKGSPVPSAQVYLFDPNHTVGSMTYERLARDTEWRDTISDANGKFSVDLVPPNPLMVFACKQGYAVGKTPVLQNSDTLQDVRIVLRKGGTIEGRVTMGGQPLSWKVGYPVYVKIAGEERDTSVCDSQGAYRFEQVEPDDVVVEGYVFKDGTTFLVASPTIQVNAGATVVMDFDLPIYEGSLQGTISAGGQPPKRVEIVATWTNTQGEKETAQTSYHQEGRYTLDYLPTGKIQVHVAAISAEGAAVERDFVVDVVSGQPTEMDFQL